MNSFSSLVLILMKTFRFSAHLKKRVAKLYTFFLLASFVSLHLYIICECSIYF